MAWNRLDENWSQTKGFSTNCQPLNFGQIFYTKRADRNFRQIFNTKEADKNFGQIFNKKWQTKILDKISTKNGRQMWILSFWTGQKLLINLYVYYNFNFYI
jgi:hypothetical protein